MGFVNETVNKIMALRCIFIVKVYHSVSRLKKVPHSVLLIKNGYYNGILLFFVIYMYLSGFNAQMPEFSWMFIRLVFVNKVKGNICVIFTDE